MRGVLALAALLAPTLAAAGEWRSGGSAALEIRGQADRIRPFMVRPYHPAAPRTDHNRVDRQRPAEKPSRGVQMRGERPPAVRTAAEEQ